jgi:hypothetical protein
VDDAGRFAFDVPVALPMVGEIVRYRGWLRVMAPDPAGEGRARPCRE